MAIQSKIVLKTYFNAGDKPSEQQFINLIDSFLHVDDVPAVEVNPGTTASNGTTGSVLFINGALVSEDNTYFFYDKINKRLGVGATSPSSTIDIRFAGSLSTDIGLRLRNSANTQTIFDHNGDGSFAFRNNSGNNLFISDGNGIMAMGNVIVDTSWGLRLAKTGSTGSLGNLHLENSASGSTAFKISKSGTGGGIAADISNSNSTGYNTGLQLIVNGAGTANYALYLDASNATGGAGTNLALFIANGDISLTSASGHKIGTTTTQKLSFWNATPIVQPTTGIAGATHVGGIGPTLKDDDTFDGYTIAQVVKALRNVGLLA